MANSITFINFNQANELDQRLMSDEFGYKLEQLMELAGYSVAKCIYYITKTYKEANKILIICGPGNNGGDGLVAGRHLRSFGFKIKIYYPIIGKNPFFQNLKKQLEMYNVDVSDSLNEDEYEKYDLIVDAIFGFGLKGEIRRPFDKILLDISKYADKIISIDVPSSPYWKDIEPGNDLPCNISLCVPKICVKDFPGLHFLAGRFLPPKVEGIVLPQYIGSDEYVLLNK